MVRFEPTRTRHTGPIRYGTRDKNLYPHVNYFGRPDDKLVDVWVAENQDETVEEAARLGLPVLCEALGPYIKHGVNGLVGPIRPLSWVEVNHYTCAVPAYIEEGLPLPNDRPSPFEAWPDVWRPLFYGEPKADWQHTWIARVGAEVGTEVLGRSVYIGHTEDVSPYDIAVQGGVPVVDRVGDWPAHGCLIRGVKNHFLRTSPRRLEKIQRAAFNIAWRSRHVSKSEASGLF